MKNLPEDEDVTVRKFFLMEVNFAISLVGHIHKSLVHLNRVIRNFISPNKEASAAIIDIAKQKAGKIFLMEPNSSLRNIFIFLYTPLHTETYSYIRTKLLH